MDLLLNWSNNLSTKKKAKGIEIERLELKKQLREIDKNSILSENTFERIKSVFIQGNKASKQYLLADDEAKRKMLEKLLSNATIENQNVASYKFKSPYSILANTSKTACSLSKLPDLESRNLQFQLWPPPSNTPPPYLPSFRLCIAPSYPPLALRSMSSSRMRLCILYNSSNYSCSMAHDVYTCFRVSHAVQRYVIYQKLYRDHSRS